METRFNSEKIRAEFAFLNEPVHYLDSAASSQKPNSVIGSIVNCYQHEYANVHRGLYQLSETATKNYEAVRDQVAEFIGAQDRREIIFTSGTTAAINLVAATTQLEPGDEIILSVAEHHSNLVPWQLLAARSGAQLKYIKLDENYRFDLKQAAGLFTERTKVLAIAHVSNVLGRVHPLSTLLSWAKAKGACTVIDGAQAVPHLEIDVSALDCDFYAFSAHKMLGPSGVGVLYGRRELLEARPPFLGGGEMISAVNLEGATWKEIPYKFEAGTPPIAQVSGLGAAIKFLQGIDRSGAIEHERQLGLRAHKALTDRKDIQIFTPPGEDWLGMVTFYHEGVHPHDIATCQDERRVCVRAGHHCAQPLMQYLNVPATIRLSPYLYNTQEDVDSFLEALDAAEKLFLGRHHGK